MTDAKSSAKFACLLCDYNTSRKCQYNRHIMTLKHQKISNSNLLVPKSSNTEPELFTCICGIKYKHRQSLFNHKKKCNKTHELNDQTLISVLQQNAELHKQNAELQATVIQMCKNGITNNIVNNTNSHNMNLWVEKERMM